MNGVNEPDKNDKIQTFWIQMWKNKPLDESHKTGQTPGTKLAFYSFFFTFLQLYCILLLACIYMPLNKEK
ncbi:hypothetical protein Hanom_Chr17g01530451 [Helianthus anomalus]